MDLSKKLKRLRYLEDLIVIEASEEMASYILNHIELPDFIIDAITKMAIGHNNMAVFLLIFNKGDERDKTLWLGELFSMGICDSNMDMIHLAVDKLPKTEKIYMGEISVSTFVASVIHEDFLFVMNHIERISDDELLDDLFSCILRQRRNDLIPLLLNQVNEVNNSHLFLTFDSDNVEGFILLLKKTPSTYPLFPSLLKRALLKKARKIIAYILNEPSAIISQRLRNEARRILD